MPEIVFPTRHTYDSKKRQSGKASLTSIFKEKHKGRVSILDKLDVKRRQEADNIKGKELGSNLDQ